MKSSLGKAQKLLHISEIKSPTVWLEERAVMQIDASSGKCTIASDSTEKKSSEKRIRSFTKKVFLFVESRSKAPEKKTEEKKVEMKSGSEGEAWRKKRPW